MLVKDQKSIQTQLPFLLLISGFFITLGVVAILTLLIAVPRDPLITAAINHEESSFGRVALAFMDSFGLVLPALLIGIGLYLIRLGLRFSQRQISAATWARQVALWLLVAAFYFGAQDAARVVTGGVLVDRLLSIVLSLLVGAAATFTMIWINRNEATFAGAETLSSRNSRIAWNLLIPTILVLIVVALRPLEQTFIASLTDRRFASSAETQFVGFENYAQLLGIRFDLIPQCDATATIRGCPETLETTEDGTPEVRFPRSRDYLEPEYRSYGYQEVNIIELPGTRLVLSARDRDFIQAIGNTLTFTLLSVTLELTLGLFIAMVVNSKFVGRGLLRTAMLVPWAIPTVVSARLWEVMLRDNQSGIVNSLLVDVGILERANAWLATSDLQLVSVVLVDVWKTTPFMALILLAGLQLIPSDIYEAAGVDGANKVRQFFSITLPLLRPTIAVALVFRTLDAIRVFDVFQVLLGRQKLSMATYNYEKLIQSQEFGYASTIGVVIFVIILLFTVLYVRMLGVQTE